MAILKVNSDILEGIEDVIALTLQVNDLGEINTRKGFSTNTFSVPKTDRNLKALGYANVDERLTEDTPATKIPASLRFNSFEEFGYIQIKSVDQDNVDITFYSNNADWFSALGETELGDYNYTESDHIWSKANIAASWDFTNTWVYPIIDYGENTNTSAGSVSGDTIYPCITAKSVIRKALNTVGFKPGGEFWDGGLALQRLIIPVKDGDPQYPERFTGDRNFRAKMATDFVPALIGPSPTKVDNFVVDPSSSACTPDAFGSFAYFDNATGIYTPDQTYNTTMAGEIDVAANDYSGVRIFFSDDGTTERGTVAVVTTPGAYPISYSGTVSPSDSWGVYMSYTSAGTTFTITACSINTYWTNTLQSDIQFDSTFSFDSNLPEIKVRDLIKKVVFDNALIVTTDAKTKDITFSRFEDIKNNTPIDWSSKFLSEEPYKLDFTEQLTNYAKVNNCTYQNDDDDTYINTYEEENKVTFGSGALQITNAYVTGESDLFENEFAGTKTIESFMSGGSALYVPFIPFVVDAEAYTPEPRILFYTGKFDVSDFADVYTQINIDSTNYSQAGYAHFYKPELSTNLDAVTYSLAYREQNITDANDEGILDDNFTQIQRMLNKSYMFEASFNLNDTDIANVDFTRPIYLNLQLKQGLSIQGLYFLNKVEEYTGEQDATVCKLIKLV